MLIDLSNDDTPTTKVRDPDNISKDELSYQLDQIKAEFKACQKELAAARTISSTQWAKGNYLERELEEMTAKVTYLEAQAAENLEREIPPVINKALEVRQKNKPSHVAVLLDGNVAMFLDSFVDKGRQGGHEAANALKNAIRSHLGMTKENSSVIVVKIYAAVQDLNQAYSEWSNVPGFIHGFHMYKGLYELIDVGPSPESTSKQYPSFTQQKLKAAFEECFSDNRYSKILIGLPPHDYDISWLLVHAGNERIQVIEQIQMDPNLKSLTDGFVTIAFPQVFRDMRPKRRNLTQERLEMTAGNLRVINSKTYMTG